MGLDWKTAHSLFTRGLCHSSPFLTHLSWKAQMFSTSVSLPLTLKFYLPAEPSILIHPKIFYHGDNSTVVFECIQIFWNHGYPNPILKTLWRLLRGEGERVPSDYISLKNLLFCLCIWLFFIWMHILALTLLSSVHSYACANATVTNFIKKNLNM